MKDWEWAVENVGTLSANIEIGPYVVVNRQEIDVAESGNTVVRVRVDVMSATDEPMRSFIGHAHDVRIAVARFLGTQISAEHASYIGWEINRAESEPNYVQD